ncbi:Coiled-coil domain-containing protein 40 [Fasciolopsis buskii]|uniref:Coiled-coil domain-containing protein 40 n=1 Tax=Fasciolopsis buskii TaxID=27845 RepID=A0A8E0VIC2_9TREM|nr:Coiled-coil domain-containing protein 40 [Fasciolopsis buski]
MKISDLREQLLILENEQLGHKRSIVKEQEQHEKLTALVNKNEADLNTIKKQTLQVNNRYEADKQSYSTYSRMLQETERNLANAVAIAQLENQIARDELTTATKQAENHHIREQLKELDDEIEERNTLITKLEAEIHHATIQVERKQGSLDLLNRKLDRLLHEAGVCHIRIRCIKRSQKLIFLIIAYL